MSCNCACHANGAFPPPCDTPGGCGPHEDTRTGCVLCTNRADVGYLCIGHLERLAATLRDIEDEATHLDPVPSLAVHPGRGKGSLASERAPARLDVLAFLDPQTRQWTRDTQPRYMPPAPKAYGPWCLFCEHETCTAWRAGRPRDLHDDEADAGSDRLMSTLGVLHGWARVVREDRELAQPDQVTVTGERDLLSRHLDWCAAQPFIDEMYAELRQLRASLKALNGTEDDKPVGRCYLPAADGVCGGPIWLDTAAGHAHCGRCRATWDGERIAALKWELDMAKRPKGEDGNPMLTAQEIATRRGLSVNAVRLTLSRNGARVVDGRYYDPAWMKRRADVAS